MQVCEADFVGIACPLKKKIVVVEVYHIILESGMIHIKTSGDTIIGGMYIHITFPV